MEKVNYDLTLKSDSVAIISRWLSTNAIFTSTSVLITYGMMQGFIFGAMAFIAVGICYVLLTFLTIPTINFNTLIETDRLFKFFLLINTFFTVFLLSLGGGMVISIFFRIPLVLGITVFMVIGSFFSLIKKLPRYRHYLKIFSLFLLVTCWMVYTYITTDVVSIYNGMRLYHPYLFYINWHDLLMFSIAVFLIFASKVLLDNTFVIHSQNRKINFKTALLLGLTFSALPISFSVLTFSVTYQGIFESSYTIFRDLFFAIDNILFSFIFFILVYVFIDTFHMEFKHLERIGWEPRKLVLLFMPIILSLVLLNEKWVHFHYLFFLSGILSVAFLPVLLSKFFKRLSSSMSKIGFVSALIGYMLLLWVDLLQAVLLAFLVSSSFTVLSLYINKQMASKGI